MEYSKKCLVCGKIFCFTDSDIKSNNTHLAMGALSALGTIAGALSGNTMGALVNDHLRERNENKIKDYTRCPYCGSHRLTSIDSYDESVATQQVNSEQIKQSVAFNEEDRLEMWLKENGFSFVSQNQKQVFLEELKRYIEVVTSDNATEEEGLAIILDMKDEINRDLSQSLVRDFQTGMARRVE